MAERPRLFLHIGLNKTGTSAIQRFLAQHPDALRQAGFLYPRTGRGADAHYGISRALGFAHGRDRKADPAECARLGAALASEFARSRCNAVVLSSEDFVIPADAGPVREFLAAWDTRVVVYLRRHDHWWLSAYNQAVRMVADPPWPPGGVAPYVRFQRARHSGYGNFRRLLERWSEAFGTGNLLVRPFESLQNPRGVVADFLETVGLASLAELAERSEARVNESAGAIALQLIDLVQRSGVSAELRERLKTALLEDEDQGPRDIAHQMKPALRARLVRENSADYAWIARTFMGRPDGVLFREPEPDADARRDPAEPLEAAEAVARVLRAVERAAPVEGGRKR